MEQLAQNIAPETPVRAEPPAPLKSMTMTQIGTSGEGDRRGAIDDGVKWPVLAFSALCRR